MRRRTSPARLSQSRVTGFGVGTIVLFGGIGFLPMQQATSVPEAYVTDEVPAVELGGHDSNPAAADSEVVRATETETEPFEAISVSWVGSTDHARVRVRHSGAWEAWKALDVIADEAPDAGREGDHQVGRAVAGLIWVGEANGYEIELPPDATDVRAHLVRERLVSRTTADTTADTPGTEAAITPPGPAVHRRSEWGARAPANPPSYADALQVAVVHHTVNSNDYAASAVPAMLRAIQAFHMDTNGWDDIGYNFVVDRFGRVWEARGGGIDRPVIGAHAMGFNTGSVGVAVLGDFTEAGPSGPAVDTVGRIVGWKLTLHSVDPRGQTTMISRGSSRYPEGTPVRLNNVNGHIDTSHTACPGAHLFARLPQIRTLAAGYHPNVIGHFDGVGRVPGGVVVRGWAIDVNTDQPIYEHTYVDASLSASLANGSRPDVGRLYPAYGPNHGFSASVPAPSGTRRVCVYGINDVRGGPNPGFGCVNVFVDPNPIGALDLAARVGGGIRVRGWAFDWDTASPINVHVYVGGQAHAIGPAQQGRSDIGRLFPAYGPNHGFDTVVSAAPGTHRVCAYAINAGAAAPNRLLGCQTVVVTSEPFGAFDGARRSGSSVTVGGWAIDPDNPGATDVHVYVGGAGHALGPADRPRPDVGRAYPGFGSNHGFIATLPALAGAHQVCAYAINTAGPGSNRLIGCRTI